MSLTQTVTAGLVELVGTTAAFVAMAEGNPTLAATIQADTVAAATLIEKWQGGLAPAADVVQVLNVLMASLGVVPQIGPYMFLVESAVAVVETIILMVSAPPSPALVIAKAVPMPNTPATVHNS